MDTEESRKQSREGEMETCSSIAKCRVSNWIWIDRIQYVTVIAHRSTKPFPVVNA